MGLLSLILACLITVGSAEASEGGPKEEKVSACISCHRELGGKMAEPVHLWENSIHHQMGNNCEGCHGGDPNDPADAMSPAKGFVGAPKPENVAEFCGKCHVGVKENYMKSPHHAAAQQGAGPNCVTCHHSHDVQRASFELINETLCTQCHSYDNAQKIKKSFVSAEMSIQAMIRELHLLDKRGMWVKNLEDKLFALRNSLHQMTHTLDVPEIENKTQAVLKDIEGMKGDTSVMHQRIHKRWWIGALVMAFLAVLVVVLVRFHNTFEEGE